jgi:hybrid cluster-associated redox disulfide protein
MANNEIKLTKDMTIAQAIKLKPPIAGVFMSKGMHCMGCAIAQGETIEQAAEVHGINADELLKELNELAVQGR